MLVGPFFVGIGQTPEKEYGQMVGVAQKNK
jgi:hypothetical protein